MTIIQAIIMGIVQGLTEFLPVSSSAHLVLVPFFLNWKFPDEFILPFDTLIQLGTLLAVILYFWKDLWGILKAVLGGLAARQPFANPQARLGWLLVLASIPAGLFGLLVKKQVEAAFKDPAVTGIFLICTALLLFLAEFVGKRLRSFESIGWLDALWVGVGQALAVFPGISRSGATITFGMLRGLDRPTAARFSFLMSVPIMLAAGALEVKDLLSLPNFSELLLPVLVGFTISAVVGYLSIRWLLSFISRHSLLAFSIYCLVLGATTLFVSYVF